MRSDIDAAYFVQSSRPGFTVTFTCLEASVALREMRRAQEQRYPDVRVIDRTGRVVTEAELVRSVGKN